MITPTGNRILVKAALRGETLAGGIYVPANDSAPTFEATVVAAGPKVESISVGQLGLIGRFSETKVEQDGETYLLVTEDEVLGILE